MEWTQEAIDRMFAMRRKGWSFGIIAQELGTTRNAAIGKFWRLMVQAGHSPTPRKAVLERIESRRLSAEELRHTVAKRVYTPTRALPKVAKVGVGFMLPAVKPAPKPARTSTVGILDATGCLWAIGHDPKVIGGHTFCNHPKRDGSPYCEEHARESVADYSRELIRSTIKGAIKAYNPRAA